MKSFSKIFFPEKNSSLKIIEELQTSLTNKQIHKMIIIRFS